MEKFSKGRRYVERSSSKNRDYCTREFGINGKIVVFCPNLQNISEGRESCRESRVFGINSSILNSLCALTQNSAKPNREPPRNFFPDSGQNRSVAPLASQALNRRGQRETTQEYKESYRTQSNEKVISSMPLSSAAKKALTLTIQGRKARLSTRVFTPALISTHPPMVRRWQEPHFPSAGDRLRVARDDG